VAALDVEDGDVRWTAAHSRRDGASARRGAARADEPGGRRRRACGAWLSPACASSRPTSPRSLSRCSPHRATRTSACAAPLTALAALEAPPPAVRERLVEAAASDSDAATRRLAEVALGVLGGARPAEPAI
jgi:hypothetical protein